MRQDRAAYNKPPLKNQRSTEKRWSGKYKRTVVSIIQIRERCAIKKQKKEISYH
jgi:hypothetical protein